MVVNKPFNRMSGRLMCLLALGAAAAPVWAQTPAAGTVKTSSGQVEIVRDGSRLAAAPGAQVRSADVVRTGAASSVGIIMNDNTLLSAGANSVLQLDKFSFDHKTQQGEMAASLRKGSLSVISGAIAKNNPGAVQFSTKNMMLKVLGTEFVIEAEGDGEE